MLVISMMKRLERTNLSLATTRKKQNGEERQDPENESERGQELDQYPMNGMEEPEVTSMMSKNLGFRSHMMIHTKTRPQKAETLLIRLFNKRQRLLDYRQDHRLPALYGIDTEQTKEEEEAGAREEETMGSVVAERVTLINHRVAEGILVKDSQPMHSRMGIHISNHLSAKNTTQLKQQCVHHLHQIHIISPTGAVDHIRT